MSPPLLYTLFLCTSMDPSSCTTPFGREPSLTRQDCQEHLWMMHARDPAKRVVCIRRYKDRRPYLEDVIDSAGMLHPGWYEAK